MIAKERLVFDPSNATEGDVIAGYVYGAGGTLITSTTVASDEGLDVYLLNTSIVVTATDLDIRDLSSATDSVAAVQSGTWTVNISDNGGSITVDAVDFDIRDLTAASDSVAAWLSDGSGNAISSTGGALDVNIAAASGLAIFAEDSAHTTGDDGQHVLAVRQDTLAASTDADGDYSSLKVNATGELYVHDADVLAQLTTGITIVDGGGSITVDAVDFDIRDLTAASDSVAAWLSDGSGNAISSTGGSLDVNVTNSIDVDDGLANTALAHGATSIGTSAAVTVASPLANRKYLIYQNLGNRSVYVGGASVTTANGLRLSPGAVAEFRLGAAVSLYGISDSGTQDTRYLELS